MRLVQDGPYIGMCCLCGRTLPIKHCGWCGHDFCDGCQYSGARVKQAVSTILGRSRLFCGGTRHG